MDVLLSEEEQMVKNLAREFLEGECPPSLARAMEQDDLGYPPGLWKQMADLGWFGMSLPEAYGGQGLPLAYLGIVMEEVGRAIAPVPFHSTMVAALAINAHGSEQQRRELLPGVSSGSTILTWAFNERDPRFLPHTIQARAIADGDDFILSGTKMFVDNFNSAQQCLVVCRTGAYSEENPKEGISLLLVDTNAQGVSHVPLTTLAKDKQSIVTFDEVTRYRRRTWLASRTKAGNRPKTCSTAVRRCCAPKWWGRRGKTPKWVLNTPRTGWRSAGPSAPSSRSNTSVPT